ncbi:IS66 family insertion sequence element accessory protein TnpB [Telmatospirillum sp.]|uniref:IS66 family insertion sequence element accessory protein TnpB n=1 Tax=Telmatospirillum sp. TaxID=2079197 RepID=UPI00283C2723|nr:IS66 family insertion sequence element accessory protein TnpB [Telmatospirillum sp.]MDR3436318.1 IS66 family insertion sequence element accessory protein TnpB [Telmatospirillum sp.]
MIQFAPNTRVYLACRPVDMRKGMDGLAAQVAHVLKADPFSGHLFLFRGKRGDYLKLVYWDGSGLCLFAKRLEKHRFVWPPIVDGRMQLTPAQMALLLEGIDWRRTVSVEQETRPTAI